MPNTTTYSDSSRQARATDQWRGQAYSTAGKVGATAESVASPCGQYLHFGKMLHTQEREVFQGMYAETTQASGQDARVWEALQVFLLDHRNHPLRFESDEDNSALDEYVEVELDMLLHKRKRVRTESL